MRGKAYDKRVRGEVVHSMKGAAGGRGQNWTMEQAKQIMTRYGYQADPVEFYVRLKMMKSDYAKATQKVALTRRNSTQPWPILSSTMRTPRRTSWLCTTITSQKRCNRGVIAPIFDL